MPHTLLNPSEFRKQNYPKLGGLTNDVQRTEHVEAERENCTVYEAACVPTGCWSTAEA